MLPFRTVVVTIIISSGWVVLVLYKQKQCFGWMLFCKQLGKGLGIELLNYCTWDKVLFLLNDKELSIYEFLWREVYE